MKKIQMVDLKGQYRHIKEQIDRAIQDVIDQTAFIKGKEVTLFEQELAQYHNVKHVIGCANGTDALQLALMALDLQPGDEVISPDFTFVSTVEVSAHLRLKPVLVDVDPDTFSIDPDSIERAITVKTKAIIPVHVFGQCANMEKIIALAEKNNISVIEDNAQAIGAIYRFKDGSEKMAGTMGDIGCTSFFPSKNLGCYGDGGAIITNNDELAFKMRAIANHGMKVKYHNDYIGINSRLDTMQAAILRIKLKHLNQYIGARNKAAEYYDSKLSSLDYIKTPTRCNNSTHVFHQYSILLDEKVDRNDFQKFLQEKKVPSMIYYPIPMHNQKAYVHYGYADEKFPVSNDLCYRIISLPMHTELDTEQLKYITDSILDYFKN